MCSFVLSVVLVLKFLCHVGSFPVKLAKLSELLIWPLLAFQPHHLNNVIYFLAFPAILRSDVWPRPVWHPCGEAACDWNQSADWYH